MLLMTRLQASVLSPRFVLILAVLSVLAMFSKQDAAVVVPLIALYLAISGVMTPARVATCYVLPCVLRWPWPASSRPVAIFSIGNLGQSPRSWRSRSAVLILAPDFHPIHGFCFKVVWTQWRGTVRSARFADKRTGSNIRYEMADFGLSAFSLFFMQSPSFLAHQRALSRARERPLRTSSRIVRAMLDHLSACFAAGTPGDGWWASLPAPAATFWSRSTFSRKISCRGASAAMGPFTTTW